MKESSWNDCLEYESSIKISPDKEKAKSLIETAEERINCSTNEINEKNSNFIFEDYYSSVIEIVHAILNLEGYKVSNHICLGYYLKDVLKREGLFRIFDDLRYKRNSLTYYGKRMEFETAVYSIEQAKKLIKELKTILEGKFKNREKQI